MDPIRIGVIGNVNRDTITFADGSTASSLGGILYTVLALGYLGGPRLEVWPICTIGTDVEPAVRALLSECPSVRSDAMQFVATRNYECWIRYTLDGTKRERLIGEIGPLRRSYLERYLELCDGLLINFITGFELDHTARVAIRGSLKGPVLMDFHSLSLGRNADGSRYLRRPHDWAEWIALTHIIQMNETEAALLADASPDDPPAEFRASMLRLGPEAAVVTRGRHGVGGAHRNAEGIRHFDLPADRPSEAVDPTGCGDVFLAGLAAGRFLGQDFASCLQLAVRAAGLCSRLKGVRALKRLSELSPID